MGARWIEGLECAGLHYWLVETRVPMLAKKPDGSILWANPAFEQLLGYTVSELTDPNRVSWHRLTGDAADLAADLEMGADVVAGRRTDYQLAKTYITKTGSPVRVMVHVLRFPMSGPFDFYMVSVTPLDTVAAQVMLEVEALRTEFIKLAEHVAKPAAPTLSDKVFDWAKGHPMYAGIVSVFMAFILFGSRVSEIVREIKSIFFGP